MGKNQRRIFFRLLKKIIKQKVPGAILEVGVAEGYTSAFIARVMDHYNSEKEFHVYDSFKGMPAPTKEDGEDRLLSEGDLSVTKGKYKYILKNTTFGNLPMIHEGWIEDTMPDELPDQIAFAYVDVDFYKPTLHALGSIYPRLAPGSVVIIDDYIHPQILGAKKAVDEFMKDKPEALIKIPPGEEFGDEKTQVYFVK